MCERAFVSIHTGARNLRLTEAEATLDAARSRPHLPPVLSSLLLVPRLALLLAVRKRTPGAGRTPPLAEKGTQFEVVLAVSRGALADLNAAAPLAAERLVAL